MPTDCTVCGASRIVMRCSHCGRRACSDHYDTRHALCLACATHQGVKIPAGPHRF